MATATDKPKTNTVDTKLEIVVIPVADVDRAKRFYDGLGWRLDADFSGGGWRIVQFAPPGSGASVSFGTNVTAAAPGSAQGLYLIVPDIEAARADLAARGVKVELFHSVGEAHIGADEPYILGSVRMSGADPGRASYRSFAAFSDPDGNKWLIQEVTARLPGRVEGDTAFASSSELAAAMRRASVAHGEHEKRIGKHDADRPDWYAEYIVREQAGKPLPS
jgi:catechol 2,3-dioxygenase-like lactoylglutathione lyase family enzyme